MEGRVGQREKRIKSKERKQGEAIEIATQSDKRRVPFPWLALSLDNLVYQLA